MVSEEGFSGRWGRGSFPGLTVVVEVGVPGVAEERVGDEGEGEVDDAPRVALGEHAAHVDVLVHHQHVSSRL